MNKNTGLIDIAPMKTDYIAGQESTIRFVDRKVKWKKYLPTPENQYQPKRRGSLNARFDTQSCVSFSYLNSIECQGNYMLDKNLLGDEALKWLTDNGYIINGLQFNFSDRALAKMSNTTKDGNSLANVAHTAAKLGLIPEADWPFDEKIATWEEYMAEIPPRLLDKAKKFLEYIELPYEWVWTGGTDKDRKEVFAYHTKHAPVQIGALVCPDWSRFTLKEGDIIRGCPYNGTGHATIIYDIDDVYYNFDHYVPFEKRLALDYPIRHGLKALLQEKKIIPTPRVTHIFLVNMEKGDRNLEVKYLQQFLIQEGYLKAGLDTGFYGDLTSAAVLAMQKKNRIISWWEERFLRGEKCGPKTRAFINSVINNKK